MNHNSFAYAVPITDEESHTVLSQAEYVPMPAVPSFHVSYPSIATAMDVEYAENEFLDVIQILTEEASEETEKTCVEALLIPSTATAYPVSEAMMDWDKEEDMDAEKEYLKYLSLLESDPSSSLSLPAPPPSSAEDVVHVVEAEEYKWDEEEEEKLPFATFLTSNSSFSLSPLPSSSSLSPPAVPPSSIPLSSAFSSLFPLRRSNSDRERELRERIEREQREKVERERMEKELFERELIEREERVSYRQSAIQRWKLKRSKQRPPLSRSRSNSSLSLSSSVSQMYLSPAASSTQNNSAFYSEYYRENRAALSSLSEVEVAETERDRGYSFAERDERDTVLSSSSRASPSSLFFSPPSHPPLSSSLSSSVASVSATSSAPLNARQQATAKREREKGKFKKTKINWVSVTDLFS